MIAALLLAALPQAADRFPDVVIVIGDDIALSDVDTVDTPNLDFLASQGVSFRNAYAHPLCSPTRRSMFFGRWPGLHVRSSCAPPTPSTPSHTEFSMAKLMKGAGYDTGVFGKWHIGVNSVATWEASPQVHGFDTWRAGLPANVINCGGSDYSNWMRVDDGVSGLTSEYQTTAVRDAFAGWWNEPHAAPRFAWVGYQAAHSPFHVPPRGQLRPPTPPGGTFSVREKFELMIESLDQMLGDMLGELDLSRTYVVFIGDNGTPRQAVRQDQDPNKVKKTTFRDGVLVPLVVAGPGITPGESDALVHAVDLLATIAELIDAPVPAHLGLDSRSFAGALADPAGWRPERRFLFVENDTPGTPHDRAVLTRRWKLRNVDGKEELYDIRVDPAEEDPLDLTRSDLAASLARLRAILADPSGANPPLRTPARYAR
jgi:arylsulfatase A-like enzyme